MCECVCMRVEEKNSKMAMTLLSKKQARAECIRNTNQHTYAHEYL